MEPPAGSPPSENPENVFPTSTLPPHALKLLFSVHSKIKTVSYVTLRGNCVEKHLLPFQQALIVSRYLIMLVEKKTEMYTRLSAC